MQRGESIIEVSNVCKSFGGVPVLKDFSCTVGRGEKLALIGPSGSGKTTMLRILMTLEELDSGTVTVDGEHLWHVPRGDELVKADEKHLRRMRRRIGMIFQHFNLFPHRTVLQNVAEPPVLSLDVAPAEAESRARELLGMVGLADKTDQYPSQLSGGQKQRVAIARALAMRPEIMLFDEITSALDPELVEEVLNVLRDIGRTTDMTMLLVTHEMSFAHEFADRVLFLDGGRIVEEGTPDELFRSPKEERTRLFLRKIISAGQRLD
jgi:polar amino acid transport system ATP-binding protein